MLTTERIAGSLSAFQRLIHQSIGKQQQLFLFCGKLLQFLTEA